MFSFLARSLMQPLLSTDQASTIVHLLGQIETKICLLYSFGFCVTLTSFIMTDPTDKRWLLIWTAVFPGLCIVIFQDACTFQARTTIGILNVFLFFLALPTLFILWLSLSLNIEDSVACSVLGDGSTDGLNAVGKLLRFPMPPVTNEAGAPTEEGKWLPYVTMMLLTNMLFVLKSVWVSGLSPPPLLAAVQLRHLRCRTSTKHRTRRRSCS